MKVDGKVALITGGARGFGKGFAEALLENGAKVCLLDVETGRGIETSNAFNKTFGQGSSAFVYCDVTSKEQMEHAFSWTKSTFGDIDIVVNNAGIADEDNWEKTVAINLGGVMRGSFLAVNYMKAGNGGRGGLIINIASAAGLTTAPGSVAYGASKFGCVGFSRNLALQAAKDPVLKGIRVSCICPTYAETELFLKGALEKYKATKSDDALSKVREESYRQLPVMKVAEVVRAFMALVEDDRGQGGVLQVTPQGAVYVHPTRLKDSKL